MWMDEAVPYLTARTLAEARLYLVLGADEDLDGPEEPPGEQVEHVEPVEGPEGWTLRSGRVAVFVPYASEAEARDEGELFGVGLSELLDPGQWHLAAAGYARRALADDLEFAEEPGDEQPGDEELRDGQPGGGVPYLRVVRGWEAARDAVREVLKFLPPGEDQVPEEAFWTETGLAARAAEPERFRRDRLTEDVALYQGHLDDFRRMNG